MVCVMNACNVSKLDNDGYETGTSTNYCKGNCWTVEEGSDLVVNKECERLQINSEIVYTQKDKPLSGKV